MSAVDALLDAPDPWADPHGTIASILGPGQISSAGRTAAQNTKVGGSATSSHLDAQAVDWIPADGNTRAAAQKLAAAGLPYDQIIDETTHVHVGYGPRMRHQALTSAQPTVDDILGPAPTPKRPTVDDILGPAPAAVPKLKPNAVPVPPSLMDKFQHGVEAVSSYMADNPVSNYVGQEINTSVVKPVTEAGHAIADSYRAAPKVELNPLPKIQRDLKVAGSIINIPMSLLNAVPHALVERPVAAAMTANPLPAYAAPHPTIQNGKLAMAPMRRMSHEEEQASNEGAVTNALMALGPGEGGAHGVGVGVPDEGGPRVPPASEAPPMAEAPKPTVDELLGPKPTVDELLGPESAAAEGAPAAPETPADFQLSDSEKSENLASGKSGNATLPAAAEDMFPVASEPAPKAMAAEVEHPEDPTLEGPGPVGGDVVGSEADPVERVDNALYRVAKHNDVAKAEGMKFLKDNEAIIGDQALQETLHHEIEKQLVDPEYKIGDDLDPETADRVREAEAVRAPLAERQREAINRRREMGDPEAAEYQPDRGYVPRYVEGHDPLMDAAAEGPQTGDPILGGRYGGLSTKSASAEQRTGFMATDQDGNTVFTDTPDRTDIMDRPYTSVRPATTAEIEANTGTRYNKNATVNTIRRALHDEAVVRHLEVLEELKKGLTDQGLAVRDYWYRKNEAGEKVQQSPKRGMGDNGGPAMEDADLNAKNFRSIPEVPQLDGYRFAPHIAETLEDYYHRPTPGGMEDLVSKLAAANRLLTAPMFLTPTIHGANVVSHWGVGRGFDHVTPGGMKSLLYDGASAIHQVFTMGPIYRELLQHGMGGQYIGTQTRNYHATMLKAAGKLMDADPEMQNIFSKAAGVPWKAIKGWYNTSSKALWYINDVLLTQRVLELKRKGMTTREAIYEAEREIPNYRIPPRVGGTKAGAVGRVASLLLQSSAIGIFNRYKYGAGRAWAALAKDLALMHPENGAMRTKAVGQLLVAIVAISGIMPALNWTAQKVTGNKNAKFRAPGGLSMIQAINDVATGNKDPSMVSSTFMSPGPALQDTVALVGNHDFYGRNIMTPAAPRGYQAAEAAKYMGTQGFYPGRLAAEIASGHGDQAAGQLVGLQLPTQKQVQDKIKYAAKDKAAAARVVGRTKNLVRNGDFGKALNELGKDPH